jgi:hypothetical protein
VGRRSKRSKARSTRSKKRSTRWQVFRKRPLWVQLIVGAVVVVLAGVAWSAGALETETLPSTGGEAAMVDDLVVAPEANADTYDRDEFADWIDESGNGCDTRAEVLKEESITPAQIDGFGCRVVAGDWVSHFDGEETSDPSDLDIDHLVPLSEAWRSGASEWTPERRRAFANDLDEPVALIAVTAASNRAKGDKDPADWQPSNREYWCDYASDWVKVKVRWELTADQAEVEALRNMLASC